MSVIAAYVCWGDLHEARSICGLPSPPPAPQPSSTQPTTSCPTFARVSASGRVTKIAIDKRARESENRGHEENRADVLPASGRLCGEEAAGCGDPASHTESDAANHCRSHRTLCSSQAGKCQHGDLQLSAQDHRDRFKDGAHHPSLQENERRTMRPGLEGKSFIMGRARLFALSVAYPPGTGMKFSKLRTVLETMLVG